MYRISNEREQFLPSVRISKITLDQFKGVEHGELECNCAKEKNAFAHSDILALYGKNGTGKTSVIDAINIVKAAIMGLQFGPEFLRFISVRQTKASVSEIPWARITIEFIFKYPHGPLENSIDDPAVEALVEYSLKLTRESKTVSETDEFVGAPRKTINYVGISEETVRTNLYADGSKGRIHVVADSNNPKHYFCPAALEKYFFTDYSNVSTTGDLSYLLRYTRENSQSFIFNEKVSNLLRFSAPSADDQTSENPLYYNILCDLHLYATRYLYIAGMKTNGILQSGAALPIHFPGYYRPILFNSKINKTTGFTDDTVIPEKVYNNISLEFQRINDVISMFVPHLSLSLEPNITRHTTIDNGQPGGIPAVGVELMVHHTDDTDYRIPLAYESAGTLNLISLLTLYIFAFRTNSATLVVDELDSGFHDILLRDILEIFSREQDDDGALGQLIFTCHNLTAMDRVLNKKYIRITTTDINDRYAKVQKIGVTNNMRDVYILREKTEKEELAKEQNISSDQLCALLRGNKQITES